jgi:hypothetical protein
MREFFFTAGLHHVERERQDRAPIQIRGKDGDEQGKCGAYRMGDRYHKGGQGCVGQSFLFIFDEPNASFSDKFERSTFFPSLTSLMDFSSKSSPRGKSAS